MSKVHYVAHNGVERTIEVPAGESVMQGAVTNAVSGIDADCGGQCACATCHVFIDPAWVERTGQRTQQENDMLNFAAELRDSSRLACQVQVTAELDGLVVAMPEGQH